MCFFFYMQVRSRQRVAKSVFLSCQHVSACFTALGSRSLIKSSLELRRLDARKGLIHKFGSCVPTSDTKQSTCFCFGCRCLNLLLFDTFVQCNNIFKLSSSDEDGVEDEDMDDAVAAAAAGDDDDDDDDNDNDDVQDTFWG